MLKSTTLSRSIDADPGKVAAFVSSPENLPRWATTFCRSVRKSGGGWTIETPQGPLAMRIAPANDCGILDHFIKPASGPEVFVPLRVVPNGTGSEVLFTVFRQPGMTDEDYARDIGLVNRDLDSLKKVMQERG